MMRIDWSWHPIFLTKMGKHISLPQIVTRFSRSHFVQTLQHSREENLEELVSPFTSYSRVVLLFSMLIKAIVNLYHMYVSWTSKFLVVTSAGGWQFSLQNPGTDVQAALHTIHYTLSWESPFSDTEIKMWHTIELLHTHNLTNLVKLASGWLCNPNLAALTDSDCCWHGVCM